MRFVDSFVYVKSTLDNIYNIVSKNSMQICACIHDTNTRFAVHGCASESKRISTLQMELLFSGTGGNVVGGTY